MFKNCQQSLECKVIKAKPYFFSNFFIFMPAKQKNLPLTKNFLEGKNVDGNDIRKYARISRKFALLRQKCATLVPTFKEV